MSRPSRSDRLPVVPANVADAVCKRWPDHGAKWLDQVHHELSVLCKRYKAVPAEVMQARYGFVIAVDTPHGPLIMRSSPDPNGANQGRVAVALADLGVSPKIHELLQTDFGSWMVADRVLPGTPLGDFGGHVDPGAIAALLQPIVGQPAPAPNLPSLVDWLRGRLTDPQLTDLPIGRSPAPGRERQQALSQLEALTTSGTTGMCHGDASPRNVLVGADNRLWLIDPRGVAGEADYDAAVIALKAARRVSPKLGADRLASYIGIDPTRAHAWIQIAEAARV